MKHIPLPRAVADIYKAVEELERIYPERKFTPDGHLVGSIGEVIAKEAFGLQLYPMSHQGHDAKDKNGREVQIKLTRGKSVSMYECCDRLIVMRIVSHEMAELIYDGDGEPAWLATGGRQKNGQHSISVAKLQRLHQSCVPASSSAV